jgi:hypothetical protein
MALTLADRIKQYTTSTGTGGLSFTGTPAGFAAFSSVLSSGDTTYYAVEENDKWEVGVGTYGSDNMARSQVLASSNGGNRVNLGGSGIVFITYPADKATYLNENDEYVLGASGLLFSNGTVFKDAKLTELTDVVVSGTVASTHVLALNNTNKSLLLGDITGPSNSNNTLIGYGAASGITSAHSYVSIGTESAIANDAGIEGVSIGVLSGPSETAYTNPASYVVSVGYKAGSRAKSDVTAIGHQAGMAAYETGFVAVGSAAGYGIGSYSVGVGKEAAHGNSSDYVVAVGHQAAKSAAGESAVWVGNMAGSSASSSTKSVGIGYQAGKSSSATDSIYIGQSAGQSNSDDDYLYISNGSPSSSRTLIKGDMQSKRLAVGAADVTLEDTFYIGIASSADKGLVVKSAVSQSDDLTQWQTSAGGSLASVSNLGVITANQVVASGQGLKFSTSQVPTSTTDTLYGFGGTLYWGLSPVTAPSGASGSVAFYNSTKAAIYSDDFTFDDDSNALVVGSVSLQDKFIGINDVGKIKVGSYPGIDDGITESDYSVILGHYTAVLASGSPYSVFAGNYAGYRALNLDNSQTIGSWAAAWASGSRNVYIGGSAGVHATGNYNVFIGDRAGKECVGSQNIEIIASGDYSFSPLNGHSNKVHIGQTIIGDTDSRRLAFGLVGSSNVSPDATVEIFPKTDDLALKVHGSGEFASGVALPSAVPASTTNMLYNDAGTLKFNGSAIGGGDVTTDQLNYVSGVATYASGQAIANEADIATNVSNISTNTTNITNVTTVANYASGEALSLNAASGQVATNATNISTNTSNIATNVTDIVATSGIANYASGQAITNKADIATNTSSISTNTSSIATNASDIVATSGIANYASGQAIANEADIVSTVAVANYASGEALSLNAASGQAFYASGNTANIAFGSNLEGDILYHNGTSFTRLPKGTDSHVLTMDGNVPAWEAATGGGGDVTTAQLVYVSGIAVYGSGQAESLNYASGVAAYASGNSLTNASDVVAVSGIAAYASGHVHNDLYVSGIATYASGQAIANETDIATNVSNISTNTSNISTNTTNISTNSDRVTYASGQAIENEADIVYVSGVANYASGMQLNGLADVSYGGTNLTNTLLINNAPGSAPTHGTLGSDNTSNIGIGRYALEAITDARGNTAVGHQAMEEFTGGADGLGHFNVAFGQSALAETTTGGYNVALGALALQGDTSGGTSTIEGNVAVGYGAARNITTGDNNIALGLEALYDLTTGSENIAIGYRAGGFADGDFTDDSMLYIANDEPSNQGTLIKGDMANKYLAIGKADATLSTDPATLQVYPNAATDKVLLIQGHATQSDDLTSWQTSTGAVVAGMTPSGVLNTYGVVASGAGVRLHQITPDVTTDTLYNVGGSLYFDGSAVGGGGGDVTTAQLVYVSGLAVYGSGQAQSLGYASGVAAYASGQAIANETDIATNVSNISTNTSNISTNTTNITSTTAVANYASGEALSLNAASGQAVYASGQAIANEGDIVATSGISAYASGQAITNKANIATNTSNISTNTTNITSTTAVANYASGEAVSLNYASGVAVYASGQVDVATDGTAEASKALILDSAKSFAGVKNGTFDQFDSWLHSSGVSVGNSGVLLANNAPSDTSNALYNVGGTLYFNGSQLASAGGASAIAQYASGQAIENESDIVAVSGIAAYASGHVHNDLYVSGIAAYASGQAIANETDIATNVSNISTNTTNIATNVTNIASTTAVANYASGEAVGVDYVSGIAVYSSGQAIANETDIATNTSNISTNTSNISTNTTNISTNSARVTYASGQAIANEGDIVAVSGIAAYASGHVHNDLYVSGIATYASGQAIENETAIATNVSNISTNTSNISTNTSNISTNSDRVTYASGQAIANETDIVATSGIANYASGQAIANETDIATNASNISTNTSNISTNTSNVSTNSTNITATTAVANYASGEVVSLNYASGVAAYASGQAIENETAIATNVSNISTNTTNITANASNVVATSGIANYASGQAISNKASIATNTSNISTNTSNISTNVTNITSTTAVANYASGEALSLNAASGQAVYASGQAIANETDIATNVSSIATNATNITANDSDIVAITGVAGYASGQAITNKANIATNTSNIATNVTNITANDSDIVAITGVAGYASGQAITNKANIATNTSNISTNTSNISTNTSNISTNATNITSTTAVANYASGQVNVTTDGTAEASKALILDSAKTFTGVKDGNFSQFDSWAKASGVQVGASGVVMKDADLSHTITLKTPDVVSTSFTLPLPSGIGTNGQVLTTDSEQTYWSTVSGGGGISWDGATANGVATFKDSNEATVESNLTFNGNTLTVATSSASAVPTVIKGDSAQTADLTSWQNSAGTSVAAMTPSGVLNTGGVVASGAITVIAEETTPLSIQGKSTGNSVFEFKAGANQAIVNVIAGSNQNARLRLGDTDNADSGEIYYKNSNDTLFIRGNDANRIVIGSDGRTGFGTSASAPSVGYIDVVANNGTVMCSGVRGHLLDNGTTDGTTTFDINQSTVHAITLDENATFSVTNARAGDRFMIRVLQDGSGGHAVTWWSTIKWAGNVTPTLSAANKADLLGFLCTGTNTYDGFIVGQGI